MRIGFAITSLHGGGAEFTVRRWTDQLCARGHSVYLYTYKPPYEARELPAGAYHHHFPGHSKGSRIFGFPVWLRRRVQSDELDVLVTMMTFANLVALIGMKLVRPAQARVVISERNTLAVKLRLEGGNRFRLWLTRRLYRHADGVIAISHPVAADVVGSCQLDASRTFVVPNPVTDAPYEGAQPSHPATLHVVSVGRLVGVKRPMLFVDALAELSRGGIVVKGTVIGDGPLRGEAEAYSANSGLDIQFLGWQEPWWETVEGVDCLLHCSDEEGFGNVLVEAAAAGIPCVARSSALGVADAVVPGITGELVAGGRPRDLADGVLRALRVHNGDARERWLEHFSASRSADLLLAALEVSMDGA